MLAVVGGPRLLDLDDFASRAFERFRVAGERGRLDLELVQIEDLGPAAIGRRRAFSLVFRGPRELPLAQGIHRLEHAVLGALEMFLVPIGADAGGMRYEAIFN